MHLRLKEWMNYKGVKSSEFALKIGVNKATISHILSGRNKPSIDFIYKLLLNYPELDANWLVLGKGNMLINNEKNSKKIEKVIVLYEDSSFQELNS
ncbi:MAG: transcriptional regulator [Flavobacteriales bacterium]|nr:transcriptional regulator [Flavobacteriales bacterium]|tara:strand:+ start:1306 stop:1593 length:288 start_codon:yes stop_codon:yes gene_type:complete